MFMVKDFWAMPEYAELLEQMNQRIYPFVVGGKGTAEEALDGARRRLERDVQEVQALQVKRPAFDATEGACLAPLRLPVHGRYREEAVGDSCR